MEWYDWKANMGRLGYILLLDFLKGLAIGIGAVAPGVSGGTLAVIFGIYEKMTEAIATHFRDFWNKVKTFFFLGLGGVVGVIGFSNIIGYLFRYYELEVKYLFIGLMAGTFPALRKQANKQGFQITYLISFAITFTIAILFAILNNTASEGITGDQPHFLLLVLYGAVIGFGTIIPGISASFLLMYLGSYEVMIDGIARLNPWILIPAGIGFLISVLGFAKLINLLFQKAYGSTYYAIFGLTVGSIFAIFPGLGLSWRHMVSYLFLTGGFILSYYLSTLDNRQQVPRNSRSMK